MPIVSKIISRFWPKASVSLFPAPCSPTWPWPMIHQQQHVTCERFVKEWKKEWSSAPMGTWVLEKLEEPWLRKGQLLLCKTNSISKKYLPSKIHNKLSNVWQINTIVFLKPSSLSSNYRLPRVQFFLCWIRLPDSSEEDEDKGVETWVKKCYLKRKQEDEPNANNEALKKAK